LKPEELLDDYITDGKSDVNMEEDFENLIFNKERYRKYHCYRNIDYLFTDIISYKPIAVMYYKPEKELYAMIRISNKRHLVNVVTKKEKIIMKTYCFDVELSSTTPILIEELLVNCDSYFSAMLLPLNYIVRENNEKVCTKFFLCNEYCMEYNDAKDFVYPSFLFGNDNVLF